MKHSSFATNFQTAAVAIFCAAVLSACNRSEEAAMEKKVEDATSNAEARIAQAGEALDDAGLTAKVKAALLAAPGVSGLAVNVDTQNRAVTLTGQYKTQAQIDEAVAITRSIDGVRSVTSHITLN